MQQEQIKEDMATSKEKMTRITQLGVVEAFEMVGDPVQRTETKRKTRTVQPKELSKEGKIAQIVGICGVQLPSEGRSKNLGDGTFAPVQYEQVAIGRSFINGGRDERARFLESSCTEDLNSKERFLGVVWRRASGHEDRERDDGCRCTKQLHGKLRPQSLKG